MTQVLPRRAFWWIEPLFALAILAGGIRTILFIKNYGYFPQPFFYDSSDTWMDWFNTAFWAHDPGAYDSWGTVYPPISFVFLKYTTLSYCYNGSGTILGQQARSCDWLGLFMLNAWLVLNAVLIALTFRKSDKSTALYRWYALAFGFPMINGWERGNLILVCFTAFMLAHGPLLKSARLRWLFAAISFNFKVYLISSISAYLLRRRWRYFEGAMILSVVVYVVTWAIYGHGSPLEVYNNLRDVAEGGQANQLLDVWSATTYQSVYSLLTGPGWPMIAIIGSQKVELATTFITVSTRATQIAILFAALATWLRPEVISNYRIVNLITCLALVTAETGAYSQTMLIFMTFFERWEGIGRRWALVGCYVLCIPYDIYIDPLATALRPGLLNGPPVLYEFWITAGPFIRPGIILSIAFALSCVTIRTVWLDIRLQGWKDRKRARFDLPIMLGGGRAPKAAEIETMAQ